MTADFRALCVELTDCLEKADWPLRYRYVFRQWIDIARAALADEPAAPAPPADGEVAELAAALRNDAINCTCSTLTSGDLRRAAELLQRQAPQPPADGEVAELVAWLRSTGEGQPCLSDEGYARLTRAAELLGRQVLVQVPDAERPWEREGWCDELGRCWWGRPDTGDWSADWTLATPEAIDEFWDFSQQTVCLPAHSLPLPEVGE